MRAAPLILAFVLTSSPLASFAEEQVSESRPTKDVTASATFGGLLMDSLGARQHEGGGLLYQFGGGYNLRRWLSVGGVVSYTRGWESENELWRASGEARLYALTWRFAHVWGAGEGGMVLSTYKPACCYGYPTGSETLPRFAPLVGVGAGIDLLPIREISFGLEGRALLPIFLGTPVGGGPSGLSPTATFGLTFALHLPTT
jgi:hypothetical protein